MNISKISLSLLLVVSAISSAEQKHFADGVIIKQAQRLLQENTVNRVRVGDPIGIFLPSNGTTGYCWNFAAPLFDETIVVLENEEFLIDALANVGDGGLNCWQFRAIKPGKTTIRLEYKQPWDTVPAAKSVSYTIIAE